MRLRWSYDGGEAWGLSSGFAREFKLSSSQKSILDGDNTKSDNVSWSSGGYLVVQLPQVTTLSKLMVIPYYTNTARVWLSNDSTDGIDGTWSLKCDTTWNANVLNTLTISPAEDCTWIRMFLGTGLGQSPAARAFWPFGEYKEPLFEFWDSSGSSELSGDYPPYFPNASNSSDYSQRFQFKLKNVDTSTHSYSLTVAAVRYGGDATITNYMKLSTDGGTTKSSSVTISNLGAGSLSGVIDIWFDVAKANNPGDGYHYFAIHTEQTA